GINSNYAYLYGLAEQVYAGWGGGPVMLLSFSAILSRRAQSILNWWYCIASSRPRTGRLPGGTRRPYAPRWEPGGRVGRVHQDLPVFVAATPLPRPVQAVTRPSCAPLLA
ncbi:MAG: hypothetical protein QOC69_1673, partial [Mycobacterium sp.]|nr:hypothetical protein [Mycobacterium sp.]